MNTVVLRPPNGLRRVVVLGFSALSVHTARFCADNSIPMIAIGGARQTDVRDADGELVVDALQAAGVDVRIVEDIRTTDNGPYQLADDGTMLLSFSSPYIIRQDLLDLYDGRVVNTHGAPLPEWRGGGGFSWRIMAGDRRGNALFHLVAPGIDDGDIVLQRAYRFPETARYPRDYAKVAMHQNLALLDELLAGIRDGRAFERQVQDESRSTYFPRLSTVDQAWIDWAWPGDAIERFVLAFSYPYEGARTYLETEPVSILDARFVPGGQQHPFFNGIVFRVHDQVMSVCCTGGTLEVPLEHVRARRLPRIGDRLTTSREVLDAALARRIVYTPSGLKARS